MANPFEHVRPGEVINARRFNLLLDTLAEMRARLEQLEEGSTGTGVRITGFDPAASQEVGAIVDIVGANFVMPPTEPVTNAYRNIISIDGAPIPADHYVITGARTTSGLISFRVPASVETRDRPLGNAGRVFEVTVENENGRASRSYTFRSSTAVAPQPTVANVVRDGAQTRNLLAGGTARVTGTNFVDGATTIRMRFANLEYPGNGDPAIDVDVAGPTELTFAVPRIPAFVNAGSVQVDIELTVDGAPAPAVFPTPGSGAAVTYTVV
ncbi:hypothetical protein L6R52_13030 [Myxococcota bacterium]|nr:hypothetical protein [Myxococcota bacterium]